MRVKTPSSPWTSMHPAPLGRILHPPGKAKGRGQEHRVVFEKPTANPSQNSSEAVCSGRVQAKAPRPEEPGKFDLCSGANRKIHRIDSNRVLAPAPPDPLSDPSVLHVT